MVIRIDSSRPEGDGIAIQASLCDDTDPENLIALVQRSWNFSSATSSTAVMVQIQNDLASIGATAKRQGALLASFPQGKTFAAKTDAEARTFLGL